MVLNSCNSNAGQREKWRSLGLAGQSGSLNESRIHWESVSKVSKGYKPSKGTKTCGCPLSSIRICVSGNRKKLLFYGYLNIKGSGKLILNGRQNFQMRFKKKMKLQWIQKKFLLIPVLLLVMGRMYHHISDPWLPLLRLTMFLCFLKISQKWTGSTGKRKLNNDLLNLKASLHHMSLNLSQMKHSCHQHPPKRIHPEEQ